ncbi:MAG: ribonuclease HI family protein [Candidatus Omnitrophica bacterium]|nr:ribonuclease HI family protein [Candidatus Omnitrophota bacterium]MDD5512700.1 ribonuclease HI family protein [Candidatus Omnitrophota bacterium]
MKHAELYIDGAAKGNPGPAGIGVIICRDGEILKNIAQYIGRATNNVAEYTALIRGLQEAMALKVQKVIVNTDSELLCRQIKKEYKVKAPHIIDLYKRAVELISGFKEVTVRHIPREENRGADKLANIAVKKAAVKG